MSTIHRCQDCRKKYERDGNTDEQVLKWKTIEKDGYPCPEKTCYLKVHISAVAEFGFTTGQYSDGVLETKDAWEMYYGWVTNNGRLADKEIIRYAELE